ncbi:glycine--tRNA ligase subunit beta [Roseibaca sp. Y0-43]|uniref:glycine--tRNA ligase subunit beta n=1 Tax=Roseibaca sp. Y0-43 TaxID=2816854 RepID=UPI001D0CB0E7|nr:glycine--tRNA ligase subunit beta [Roseibaca sp. Y0-43]MCC1481481.1 glycine--tRNA ligase subunit beta [Roseibaca sp. Y0-43]
MADLLIELFSEEIPARMQAGASDALKKLVTDGLVEAGLTYAHAAAFATPRRLVLAVQGLSDHSPTLREERRGPKVGAPEKAIEGFLRSTGLSMDDLSIQDDKKGQVYIATVTTEGRAAPVIVAEVLERTIRNFPWPKSMRWGAGSLRWVRPLHSILCILSREDGAQMVPLDVDGIVSGDTTRGHRFMAPDAFSVTNFEDYAAKLKRAKVILDPAERADHIWNEASQMAFAQGLDLVEDKGLLAEVAGLVEWPVVLMGRIEEQFLDLPPEVLQTSMKEHQKFFSVRDPKSGQIVGFVTVANRETADQGATILAGNQKVLAARLSDAKFFWDNDLRLVSDVGLEGMGAGLSDVTFHNKLGSQADRIERIAALAKEIAPLVGADADMAEQAARVAKADLRSGMVGEFPELQGVMGRYYALRGGYAPEVADACRDHYSPLGPSDDVPTAPVTVAVALADKLDTLTGFWAIDEKPTGSKDPFALRRAALGVIRLVLGSQSTARFSFVYAASVKGFETQYRSQYGERLRDYAYDAFQSFRNLEDTLNHLSAAGNEFSIVAKMLRDGDLKEVKSDERLFQTLVERAIDLSAGRYADSLLSLSSDLLAFFHDRLKVYLRDQGIRHDVIDACLAMPGNDDLTLLVKRAEALSDLLKTDDGENLLQGFKRANNILSQAEEKDGVEYSFGPDPKLADTGEERALFAALDTAEAAITPAMQAEDFARAMQAMAGLRAPIDAFFEAVQINTDNQIVRRNRLNLLHRIRATCLQVADLTKVSG